MIIVEYFFELLNKGPWFLVEFLQYQIELFSHPVAGHKQPIYYHFLVVLFGCIPFSFFAFRNSFIDTAIFLTKEDNAIIYNGTYVNDSGRSYTKGLEGKTTHELSGVYIENNISIIDARQSNGERKLRRPNVTNKLKLSKIIDEITNSAEWITLVAGASSIDEPHIQNMLIGLEEAKNLLLFMDELSTNGRDLLLKEK